MDLIYSGPLFRSAIPVKDQKGFVLANTKRELGSINKQNQREIDRRPYRNFSQAINLLTNWLAYLYERIQSPRPDVMPDRKEGITRAAGFVFACIDTQASS